MAATQPSIAGKIYSPPSNSSDPQADLAVREVDLFDLIENGPGAKLKPVPVEISNPEAFFETRKITVGDTSYKVDLDLADREDLAAGFTVRAYGVPTDRSKPRASLPLDLALPVERVNLASSDINKIFAGGELDTDTGKVKPMLEAGAIGALIAGTAVVTHGITHTGKKVPIVLYPPAARTAPMADSFDIFDLPAFIANPSILTQTGDVLPLVLRAEEIDKLLTSSRANIQQDGHTIELNAITDKNSSDYLEFENAAGELQVLDGNEPLVIKPHGKTWSEVRSSLSGTATASYGVTTRSLKPRKKLRPRPKPKHPPGKGSKGSGGAVSTGTGVPSSGTGATPSMTSKVQPRLPSGTGLPVAVFVPWKQTWTLKGFSRGNLLHSIAMTPLEQITMQVFSWERRTRALEQSTETEVEQQTDVTQTTRDTEDVFKEMISKHDFAWQISGSIDASYSPGVASIKVSAGGGVSETNNIVQTARRSTQSVKESTVKASSRVRSKRVTRITQTVESGKEERVTRVIRNPNQCHTLTMDFFETLAHYEIKLEFLKDRLRLVVLVPNPINVPDFVSDVIRENQTALRNALIDEALVDGFEACRFVAAYDEAKKLLVPQTVDSGKLSEVDSQRDKPPAATTPDPSLPQQQEVERVATEMLNALKNMNAAEIDTALQNIAAHSAVPETARRTGQQWLFIQFCNSKLPSLLATLDDISNANMALLAAAQKMMTVLPRPDAPTNLGNLNQMSNADKELCCISSKLREEDNNHQRLYMKNDWDWGWWSGRMQEESLYSANDGGLSGLADLLQKAYTAWEGKKAQGDAMKDQDVAKTEAEGKQDKATTDDKLAMAFPLEDLARAYERMQTLMSHLNLHRPFYNYALFQALPPSEQTLRIVEASNGRLQVGLFEPRVVAMSGTRLVVPLTPLASTTELQTFVTGLANDLENAFQGTLNAPDTTILPTPGVSVSSRLGKCSCCEDYLDVARNHELKRLEGLARQEQAEADRREGRLANNDFDEFRQPSPAVKLEIDKP